MIHPGVLVVMIGLVSCQPTAHTFEQRWEPVKSMPQMQDWSAGRPLTFEERWAPVRQLPPMIRMDNDVGPRMIPVSERKLDRMIPLPDPIPEVKVKTIKFGPLGEMSADQPASEDTPPPLPRSRPEAAPHTTPPARARVIRTASLDICQRHGMHKQITRGGKSWRCRK